ncbi:MAG: hypothetical protein Q4E46_02240 [Candidatus Saccharibacteria bacterium]|nr:hypothetical protein [Candidatus Saccharibacteria bacterium]
MNPETSSQAPTAENVSDWDILNDVEFSQDVKPTLDVESALDGELTPDSEPISDHDVETASSLSSEDREKLHDFLETGYARKIGSIVEKLFFDGDVSRASEEEKRDPEAYIAMMALEDFISYDEQVKLIDEYCENGKLSSETGEKVAQKLAEIMSDSKFAEEMYAGDMFLRQRHADRMAGRYGYEADEKVNLATKIAWATDPSFETSKEARSLIGDPDYLHKTYGRQIEDDLFGRGDKRPEGPVKQVDDPRKREAKLGNALEYAIDEGALTVKEALDDPFLRGRRVESLRTGAPAEQELTVAKQLWKIDDSFYSCDEFQGYLKEVRADNTDIFEDIIPAEVEQRTSEALERISDQSFEKIMQTYEKDPRAGDKLVVKTLAPALGLGKNIPKIIYEDSQRSENGSYQSDAHTIRYCHDDGRKVPGFLRPRKELTDELFDRMNTISHEMWHAHQHHGDNVSPELREQYTRNEEKYMRAEWNYGYYRGQLLETEAFTFGNAFEERAKKIYGFDGKHLEEGV